MTKTLAYIGGMLCALSLISTQPVAALVLIVLLTALHIGGMVLETIAENRECDAELAASRRKTDALIAESRRQVAASRKFRGVK